MTEEELKEIEARVKAARDVPPDVAYVRNQDTGYLYEVRVSDFTNDVEVRRMAYTEDPYAEEVYNFSRSADTTLALVEEVRRLREALAGLIDCQEPPSAYRWIGEGVEGTFDLGLRHKTDKKPYDYLKSWLSMLRPFAYATKDDSWGEMEKLLCIVMRNYVRYLLKAHVARKTLGEAGRG